MGEIGFMGETGFGQILFMFYSVLGVMLLGYGCLYLYGFYEEHQWRKEEQEQTRKNSSSSDQTTNSH